jgi:Ni/Co efflux regulator RcnB/surface antigen
MKRILSAALALSLVSGGAALAQPNDRDHNDHSNNNNDRGRDGDQSDNDHRQNTNRNNQNRNDDGQRRSGNDRGWNDQAGNQRRQDDHNSNRGNRRWSKGDRLPTQYRQQRYYVTDWRQHGLQQPPRGYHWVRNDYNDFFLAAISTGIIATVIYRDQRDQRWSQRYSRTYTYNDDIYYRDCRNGPDPAGVIAGALIGGLIGNAAGRGGARTGSTIAGVVVGGAVGAALTSNLNCEDRSYAYKTYYEGFNSGRPGSRYEWRNPRNNHRGEFRVGSYYNDRDGFRCAKFTQTIHVQGRRQQRTSGIACRQPNGTWAIVN